MKNNDNPFPEISNDTDDMLQRTRFAQMSDFDRFFEFVKYRETYDFYGFIHFKEKDVLCGSYEDHYGFFTVADFRKLKPSPDKLESVAGLLSNYLDSLYKNTYSYPREIQKYVETKYGKKSKTYFSNYKITNDRSIFQKGTCKGSFLEETDLIKNLPEDINPLNSNWEEDKCSSNTLTNKELIELTLYINSLPNAGEIFEYVENKVQKEYQNYYDEVASDKAFEVSVERPIEVCISGNDDCSYSKAVSSMEEAYAIYTTLKEKGGTTDFHDLIDELKMSFTN